MPEKRTLKKSQSAARRGKAPSTQAGPFVEEEMRHIREGKHGARSARQAIAIGLSKARKAGVKLPPRGKRVTGGLRRRHIAMPKAPAPKRSRAVEGVLKREPRSAASHRGLSRQAHRAFALRGPLARSRAAQKAVRTKGPRERMLAAQKVARTRRAA